MDSDTTPSFIDCQSTCKTSIGCTCDKAKLKMTDTLQPKKVLSEKKGGCSSCSCSKNKNDLSGANKLEVYDWLKDISQDELDNQMVEVQFKNTRKEYYINSIKIPLKRGDVIAVESSPGHDIGEVTLTGKLVQLQMKKNNFRGETKRVYRIAKPNDIEKYEEAKAKEYKTMLRAREIAEDLKLNMKISDVEYQGDGNKSIFYYIADDRVDFRELIKLYASEFRIKIEMKQIGARQEAGRVGGIGPCGRELCCSSSMANFVSVSTSAARVQDLPLNPQKLAGQCGKLKCCLNYEVDTYMEAQRKLPPREVSVETRDATFFHFKTDILAGMMTYSTDKHFAANLITVPRDRIAEVIRMNKKGEKPTLLQAESEVPVEKEVSLDVLDGESITRFDKSKRGNKNNNSNRNSNSNREPNNGRRDNPNNGRKKNVQKKELGEEAKPATARNNNTGNRPQIQSGNTNKRVITKQSPSNGSRKSLGKNTNDSADVQSAD